MNTILVIDPVTWGLIIAGLLATGGSVYSQVKTNKTNQAIADATNKANQQQAEKDWRRYTEYNDPSQLVARLRQAGLSPQMALGNGATFTASPMKTPEKVRASYQAPQLDLGGMTNAMMSHYNIKEQRAQLQKINSENKNLQAKYLETLTNTAKSKQEMNQAQGLYQYSLKQAELNNRLDEQRIDFNTKVMPQNITMNDARIQLLGKQIVGQSLKNEKTQFELSNNPWERRMLQLNVKKLEKTLEIMDNEKFMGDVNRQLWIDYGLRPQDPLYWRVGTNLIDKLTKKSAETEIQQNLNNRKFDKDYLEKGWH